MSELIVDLGKHEFIHLVRPVQNMNWNTLSKLVEKEDWIITEPILATRAQTDPALYRSSRLKNDMFLFS